MKSNRLIIFSVLLFGSLWGLSELGIGELTFAREIPRAPLLTAVGILFLVLTRRLWNAPGSSFALSALAAGFKFLQHPFWGCKVAAVLMVGAIFDIGFSLCWARRRSTETPSYAMTGLTAACLTFGSFIAFAYFARYVLQNPYWSVAAKMTDYMVVQAPAAALLAFPAAAAGLWLAERILATSEAWTVARAQAYRIAAVGSGVAGVAAALALRY